MSLSRACRWCGSPVPVTRPRSAWCSDPCAWRQRAWRKDHPGQSGDLEGRRIAAKRLRLLAGGGESSPSPSIAPQTAVNARLRPAVAAEVGMFDAAGLGAGEVVHLASVLDHLAGRVDAGVVVVSLPSLLAELLRTHRAWMVAVEHEAQSVDETAPRHPPVAPCPVAGGPLTAATLRRLGELAVAVEADVMASVAVVIAEVLDAGSCGSAEGPLVKVLRSALAAVRPRFVEVDEAMAELLTPLELPQREGEW